MPHVWPSGISKDAGSHLPLCPSPSLLSRRLLELPHKLTTQKPLPSQTPFVIMSLVLI